MTDRKTYQYRKENGLCTRCGIPADRLKCPACYEYEAEQTKALRKQRKGAGMCQRCGVKKVFAGTYCHCLECADIVADARRARKRARALEQARAG